MFSLGFHREWTAPTVAREHITAAAGLAAAIPLASVITRVVDGELVWPIAGFAATAVHLTAVASQLMPGSRPAV